MCVFFTVCQLRRFPSTDAVCGFSMQMANRKSHRDYKANQLAHTKVCATTSGARDRYQVAPETVLQRDLVSLVGDAKQMEVS